MSCVGDNVSVDSYMESEWCLVKITFMDFYFLCLWLIFSFQRYHVKFLFQVEMA